MHPSSSTLDRFTAVSAFRSAARVAQPQCRRPRSLRSDPDARPRRRVRPAALRPLSGCVVPDRGGRGGRLDAAVYRRRRGAALSALAVAAVVLVAVVQLLVGGPAAVTVLSAVFSPLVAVPVWVACGLGLVRWSGGGSRRPASPAPSV